jgi:hypothetical protein
MTPAERQKRYRINRKIRSTAPEPVLDEPLAKIALNLSKALQALVDLATLDPTRPNSAVTVDELWRAVQLAQAAIWEVGELNLRLRFRIGELLPTGRKRGPAEEQPGRNFMELM